MSAAGPGTRTVMGPYSPPSVIFDTQPAGGDDDGGGRGRSWRRHECRVVMATAQ